MLRALRTAGGVNQAGWAAALATGERTVQRWESGAAVPDGAIEARIIAYCREHNLFGRATLGGQPVTVESLQTILAQARASADTPRGGDRSEHDECRAGGSTLSVKGDADGQRSSEQDEQVAPPGGRRRIAYPIGAAVLAAVTLVVALFIVRYVEPPKPCTPNSRFVEDVNVPDGEVMRPGTSFEKKWRLLNPDADNICPWSRGYNVVWSGGPNMATGSSFDIPPARTGEQVVVTVPMVAPQSPGEYKSVWILRTPDGRKFGDEFWVIIQVRD
ncbi:MAG: hypothetical protein IT305_03910 [Chloroflexi bacterium]|nr:hypothetical protein [Chloroflexota bacterium]